jgi:hypothetical protein
MSSDYQLLSHCARAAVILSVMCGRPMYRDVQTAFANIYTARNVGCHGLTPQPHMVAVAVSVADLLSCSFMCGKSTRQQCRNCKVYIPTTVLIASYACYFFLEFSSRLGSRSGKSVRNL